MSDRAQQGKPVPMDPPDLEREFLDALEAGRNHGDVIVQDDQGRRIKRTVYSASTKIPPKER